MKHSDLHPLEVLALAAMAIAWAAWTLARVLIVPLLALLITLCSYRAREPERSCRPWEPSSPAMPRSHAPRPAAGPGGQPAGADLQWAPNLPPTAPLGPPAQPLGITGSGQELVAEVGDRSGRHQRSVGPLEGRGRTRGAGPRIGPTMHLEAVPHAQRHRSGINAAQVASEAVAVTE